MLTRILMGTGGISGGGVRIRANETHASKDTFDEV